MKGGKLRLSFFQDVIVEKSCSRILPLTFVSREPNVKDPIRRRPYGLQLTFTLFRKLSAH